MKKLKIGKSDIHGKGLFSGEPIRKGDLIAKVHSGIQLDPETVKYMPTQYGRFYNHDEKKFNTTNEVIGNHRYLRALKNIPANTELTANYREHSDMEQPENFGQGKYASFDFDKTIATDEGLAKARQMLKDGYNLFIVSARDKVTPDMVARARKAGIPEENIIATGSDEAKVRKVKQLGVEKHFDDKPEVIAALGLVGEQFKKGGGLNSKKYTKSITGTNKLFTKNNLFKKKSTKRIYDPNAKYFDNGGINKLEGDLISKVLMERNRGVDFVDRAFALGDNPGTPMFNLPDDEQFGQNMSHKMAWGEDDNGQAWMYPTIMNPNDEAIQVPNQYADYISSEGYKNATGMNQHKAGGASGCPKDFYWNGKKCVKIPKGAKVITNPKEYSERKAAYQDSSDLYKSSLGIKRFFPKLPEITEKKYDELTKKYDDLTIWNIDKVGYKEDKKSKIKKPIESYIYSYKNKDQFENPTFIKNNKDLYTDYGDDYEKYQIKLKNGDIKIPGILYKGKPDFNTAYTIISPNGTSRDYHLNYETNKFDLVGINSPTIEPIHRSYYGSDKLKKDGSIDFSSTGWYGKGKKPNKNELKQWLNHTLEFEYFDTYKKPVQPVVFQEVDKSVLPTTRTIYIDCPPGSVANGQKTDITTPDPDSPGNFLRTITTGCDPIKEKEVIVPIKEPVINTEVTKTEEVPMGTQEYPEELEGPNWEWDRKYHSFTTPRLNKHFPLGPLFNGKKKHTFSTPYLHRRKDYEDGGIIVDFSTDQIQEYINGGYIVEELDDYAEGGSTDCGEGMVWDEALQDCVREQAFPSQRINQYTPYVSAWNEMHPEQREVEQKKAEYLRKAKGLNKVFGVNADNFPQKALNNIYKTIDRERNNYVISQYAKDHGFNPNDHVQLVENIAERGHFGYDMAQNSKYGSKLKPSLWARSAAGLQELGNFLVKQLPGTQGDVFKYQVPGLSKKERKETANSKTGALEAFAITNLPGQIIANQVAKYVKPIFGGTGADARDEQDMPGILSGQYIPGVDDTAATFANPFTYTGLTSGLIGAPNMIRSALPMAKNVFTKGKTMYTDIAEGANMFDYAWKSPAARFDKDAVEIITDAGHSTTKMPESTTLFNKLKTNPNLTAEELATIKDYEASSYGYHSGPNKEKLDAIIKKSGLILDEPTVMSRRINTTRTDNFNPVNGIFNTKRPTSWSAGRDAVGNVAYSGSADRMVMKLQPGEYNMLKNPYLENSPETLDALIKMYEPMGNLEQRMQFATGAPRIAEREVLLGSGTDLKQIGKVKNNFGGFDYIMKNLNKKQYGGLHKFIDGGQPCPDGYAWDEIKQDCVSLIDTDWLSNWYANRKLPLDEIPNKKYVNLMRERLPQYNPESTLLEELSNLPPVEYQDVIDDDPNNQGQLTYDKKYNPDKILLKKSLLDDPVRLNQIYNSEASTAADVNKPGLFAAQNMVIDPGLVLFEDRWGDLKGTDRDVAEDHYNYTTDPEQDNIHSLIFEERYKRNLKPDQVLTETDINKWKSEAEASGALDRNSPNFDDTLYTLFKLAKDNKSLMNWFNQLASNDKPKTGDEPQYTKQGGSIGYKIGDEIDEATMRKLKKLGYKFQKA